MKYEFSLQNPVSIVKYGFTEFNTLCTKIRNFKQLQDSTKCITLVMINKLASNLEQMYEVAIVLTPFCLITHSNYEAMGKKITFFIFI